MPRRFIHKINAGPEIDHPEVESDTGKLEKDGQSYQFHVSPQERKVVPDQVAEVGNMQLDDKASGIKYPYDGGEAKS